MTPYDSFYLEDSLRIIQANDALDEIKKSMQLRLDKETGLYIVTVGDTNSEYYNFATMFNRMTNSVYSERVWRSVTLLNQIMKNVKRDYVMSINDAIGTHAFNEAMNREENRR